MACLNKPKSLSQVIDRIEQMREELLILQTALERIESAKDSVKSDGDRNLKSVRYQLKISL